MSPGQRRVFKAWGRRNLMRGGRPRSLHPLAWLYIEAECKAGHFATHDEASVAAKRRRVGVVFTKMLEARVGHELVVNQPPPGWTVEADIAEEHLALSELTLMRKLSQEAYV